MSHSKKFIKKKIIAVCLKKDLPSIGKGAVGKPKSGGWYFGEPGEISHAYTTEQIMHCPDFFNVVYKE
jgi:hypothetical protein